MNNCHLILYRNGKIEVLLPSICTSAILMLWIVVPESDFFVVSGVYSITRLSVTFAQMTVNRNELTIIFRNVLRNFNNTVILEGL